MAMDDEIKKQIKALVAQLTRLMLRDVARKYSISDAEPLFSPEIDTPMYKVEGTYGYEQAEIRVTLKMDGIHERIDQYGPKGKSLPRWSFLGYIKEGTFHQSIIENCKDIAMATALAEINTQIDRVIPTPFIKRCTAYTAIFLIAYDNDDTWGFEEDVLTMIHLPRAPSIEDVSELKGKLELLLRMDSRNQTTSAKETNQNNQSNKTSLYLALVKEANKEIDVVTSSNTNETAKAIAIEIITNRLNEAIARLFE